MEWQFDTTIILFLLSVGSLFGLIVGYLWRGWEDARAIANCKQCKAEREPVTYTSGAAYDACLDDEPTTDHDAVARRLLRSLDI